jgi:thiol-disulfide isomerase/thioredoxin
MKLFSRFSDSFVLKPFAVALAALSLITAIPRAARAQAASTAPEMKVVAPKDIHDLIATNKGKVVFLNFFATYCVPCHKEFPDIIKMAAKYKADVQVIAVSMNDVTDESDKALMNKWMSEVKPPFAVYIANSIDDDFYKGFDARWAAQGEALPMTMIFDRTGKEAHFYMKALSLEAMERDVTPLIAQKASD